MPNSYLVVFRCTMDDLPIRLFDVDVQASEFAHKLGDQALVAILHDEPLPECVREVENVLGLDASSPHSVAIITLIEGVPANIITVQDLT